MLTEQQVDPVLRNPRARGTLLEYLGQHWLGELSRREDFLKLKPKSKNHFFSYQCAAGEIPPLKKLKDVAVLFFDNYKPTTDFANYPAEIVCPLNTVPNIAGVCETCRRCFNGEAVDSRPVEVQGVL